MKLRRFSQFFDQYFAQFPAFDFRADENALWLFGFVKSGDGVTVVHHIKAEETTASGIILTASAQEKPQVAEIIEVGPGGVVDGKEVKMEVQKGQKVITGKYTGTEVKLDGETYIIVRQSDILAIVE